MRVPTVWVAEQGTGSMRAGAEEKKGLPQWPVRNPPPLPCPRPAWPAHTPHTPHPPPHTHRPHTRPDPEL